MSFGRRQPCCDARAGLGSRPTFLRLAPRSALPLVKQRRFVVQHSLLVPAGCLERGVSGGSCRACAIDPRTRVRSCRHRSRRRQVVRQRGRGGRPFHAGVCQVDCDAGLHPREGARTRLVCRRGRDVFGAPRAVGRRLKLRAARRAPREGKADAQASRDQGGVHGVQVQWPPRRVGEAGLEAGAASVCAYNTRRAAQEVEAVSMHDWPNWSKICSSWGMYRELRGREGCCLAALPYVVDSFVN
eukprot:1797660-Pleurochrysis_carterae.AAC.1